MTALQVWRPDYNNWLMLLVGEEYNGEIIQEDKVKQVSRKKRRLMRIRQNGFRLERVSQLKHMGNRGWQKIERNKMKQRLKGHSARTKNYSPFA